jgi:hypothetical protein
MTNLGHKTATMTLDQYGHLFPDDLDDVATRWTISFRGAQNVPKGRPDLALLLWSCRESNPLHKSS